MTKLFFAALLCVAFPAAGQPPLTGELSAKLEISLTDQGGLHGAVVLTATGASRQALRDGLRLQPGPDAALLFLGPFLHGRDLMGDPAYGDQQDQSLPFEVRLPVGDESFILPIQRHKTTQLNALELAPEVRTLSDGRISINAASYREEVSIAIPSAFSVNLWPQVVRETPFGHYQSEVSLQAGKLTIKRRLDLRATETPVSEMTALDNFLKLVRNDQRTIFTLRRRRRSNPSAWIASLDPRQAGRYAKEAYEIREYETARSLYAKALQFDPQDGSALVGMGRSLYSLGKWAEARTYFEKQISLNPEDVYALANLGIVELSEEHWAAALRAFGQVLAIRPDALGTLANAAAVSRRLGRWEEAALFSERAARLLPSDPLHKVNAAVAAICAGKTSDAKMALEAVLGARPAPGFLEPIVRDLTDCGKELDLADSYARRYFSTLPRFANEPQTSLSIADALTKQLGSSMILYTYGSLLAKKGEHARAEALVEASVRLLMRPDALHRLAILKWRNGKIEEARRLWREITLLEPTRLWTEAPEGIAEGLDQVDRYTVDGTWRAMSSAGMNLAVAGSEPSYFFVVANLEGAVVEARQLDPEDSLAKTLLPEIHRAHVSGCERRARVAQ